MKSILGHSHVPTIHGVVQVGNSVPLWHSYNTGPSAWQHSHAIIHVDYEEIELRMIRALAEEHPTPRRREAVLATRRKHGRN